MFHLVLPSRPFHVEITYYFVSTSPNLEFTILTQTFASLHYFTVQCSDLEILMNLNKANLRDLIAATGLVILLKLD